MIDTHPAHDDPVESEDKWQKHVMVVLWLVVALVIALSVAWVYADYHGWFRSSSDQPASPPAFPTGS